MTVKEYLLLTQPLADTDVDNLEEGELEILAHGMQKILSWWNDIHGDLEEEDKDEDYNHVECPINGGDLTEVVTYTIDELTRDILMNQ